MPFHGLAGCGGFQRSSPVGGGGERNALINAHGGSAAGDPAGIDLHQGVHARDGGQGLGRDEQKAEHELHVKDDDTISLTRIPIRTTM